MEDKVVAILQGVLETPGQTTTKLEFTGIVFNDMLQDGDRDAAGSLVGTPRFVEVLTQRGFAIDGETISRAA